MKGSAFGSNQQAAHELLLQTLEIQVGGIQVYETAIRCATHVELAARWKRDLEQTRRREAVVRAACEAWGLDVGSATTGRTVVKENCRSFVVTLENALVTAPGSVAQLLAAECVVLFETMDGLRRAPVAAICETIPGKHGDDLRQAFGVQPSAPTAGWARGLWMRFVGRSTILPPEEAEDHASIGGAGAKRGGARSGRSKPGPTGGRSGRGRAARVSRTR